MPEFVIKDYKVAGEPREGQYGTTQGFWINLTNGQSALWNKKVDGGPPQVGPVWGEILEETSKAGKKYFKFKKGSPESIESSPAQPKDQLQLDRVEAKLDMLLKHHKILAPAGPTVQDVEKVFNDDLPPVSSYEDQIDVEELPF